MKANMAAKKTAKPTQTPIPAAALLGRLLVGVAGG